MENSYLLENKSGDIFGIANLEDGTFGNVSSNSTVYLSKINDEICALFGIDANLFSYSVSNTNCDGEIYIDGSYPTIIASMHYNGTEIYTITFRVNAETVYRLAKVLGCTMEDLIESNSQ